MRLLQRWALSRLHPHRCSTSSILHTHSPARHISSVSSPQRGNKTTAIAFDIDGVLIRGKEVIPQAREALHILASKEMGGQGLTSLPFMFLTNGGGVSEAKKAAELSSWFDLCIPPSSVCVSHTPMHSLLPHYRTSRILVLGMTDVKKVALEYGFTDVITMTDLAVHHPELVPHLIHEQTGGEHVHPRQPHTHDPSTPIDLSSIAAVFVMHDPNAWYRDMQILLDVMTTSSPPPPLFFTNPDFLFSGRSSSPRLAQGAFRIAFAALYKEYTGRDLPYELMGKPEAITYSWAQSVLNEQARGMGYEGVDRFVMVGDNPHADIRGGNRAGWDTVMVRTGTIKPSDREEDQPTEVKDHVLDAVKWIVETDNSLRQGRPR